MDSAFSLNISIASVSQLDQTQTHILEQANLMGSNWPTPIIHVTPAKASLDELQNQDESVIEDTNKGGDCFYTGRGNPVITPVNRQKNLLVLPRSCRGRLRSRSFSSHQPYKIPPAEAIRKKLRLRVDSQIVDGTPVRKRSPSESDINFAESFEIPRNEISCIKIQDEGYHDCSTGRDYLIHLKHDFLQADNNLSRPALILALEDALKNGQHTPSGSATTEKMNELQRTVVMDWDVHSVEQLLDQLNKYDLAETKIDKFSKDPLLYLLGRLIQRQRDTKTSRSDILYNSLEVTSIVGRGHKLVLNDVYKTTNDEPIFVLHMGKERAMNIIPKKLNLAMLDVFDVQLGNFSIISISQKTQDSMHISLPREKALEEDDLDLHILVRPQLKRSSEEKHGSENADKSDVTSEEERDTVQHRHISVTVISDVTNGNGTSTEYANVVAKEDFDDTAEERSTSEGPDQDTTFDQQSVVEELIDSEASDVAVGQPSVVEELITSEEPNVTLDQRNAVEKQSTSGAPDHDAVLDQQSVVEELITSEEPDATLDQSRVPEEPDLATAQHDEKQNINEDLDVTMNQQNDRQEQKTQVQWDLYDLPIFLRKETYEAIIAKQNKSNTIKKWMKHCKIKSLNNNVKNKEALQNHLLTYETGCSRAPSSIISGLIEKLIGPGVEEELKHCNVNYDPSKHISVASKKLLLRTTLIERQEGFHSRPKGCPNNKKYADPQAEVEAQPPTLLNDSSDSSSEVEDEDPWDDSNSNTEKILQFLKKNSSKTGSKSKNEIKIKSNSETTKQKTSDPRSKHDKEPLCSQNHVNMSYQVAK